MLQGVQVGRESGTSSCSPGRGHGLALVISGIAALVLTSACARPGEETASPTIQAAAAPPVRSGPLAATAVTGQACVPAGGHAGYVAGGQSCESCHPCGSKATSGHVLGWSDPASPSFHALSANAGIAACQGCHGANLDGVGGSATTACAQCHGASWKTSCVMCHGGTDSQTGAPPRATWGNTADAVRVGKHTSHLAASHGLAAPVACDACHLVPASALSAGHIDGPTATVTFGGLATQGGGTAPAWNGTDATCSNTYCHGAKLAATSRGTGILPGWTQTQPLDCSSCHLSPPSAPHSTSTACGTCHTGYTASTVNMAIHLNGTVEVTSGHPAGWADKAQHGYGVNLTGLTGCRSCHGADLAGGSSGISCATCHAASGITGWDSNCTFCHGTRSSGVASPPVDIQGRSVATNTSVGRHALHAATAMMSPMGCDACHPARSGSVITDAAHVDGNGLAEVAFGPLARTGGAAATYTRASATSATCASTYCHGTFTGGVTGTARTKAWTGTTTATCASCHGNPPGTGRHSKHQSEKIACSYCHGAGYARTGTTTGTVARATHVDGLKNVLTTTAVGWNPTARSCANSCHSSERW